MRLRCLSDNSATNCYAQSKYDRRAQNPFVLTMDSLFVRPIMRVQFKSRLPAFEQKQSLQVLKVGKSEGAALEALVNVAAVSRFLVANSEVLSSNGARKCQNRRDCQRVLEHFHGMKIISIKQVLCACWPN